MFDYLIFRNLIFDFLPLRLSNTRCQRLATQILKTYINFFILCERPLCISKQNITKQFYFVFVSVVGTCWVMARFYHINYYQSYSEYYCPISLYVFSFVVVILGWTYVLIALIFAIMEKTCPAAYDTLCCIKYEYSDEESRSV